ncbi:MAG TPA: hypothetical protein DHW61_15525 [Lachnoclostridium phytofermentans]|uniref:Uncharacterized protein n=1 Tax=Lachnoclostridium phytofermentans TaxID=66219 RepID=A0A3D2X9G4_9FIRM|nr:hypothetical protein [Lachnoclostridium phytofermentans]
MSKRTLQNCGIIKKELHNGNGVQEQRNGKCLGYCNSDTDDEPIEPCKNCKLQESYYEDMEMQDEYMRSGY